MKGLLISGPGSGVGKTTIAAAFMAALRQRGLSVQPFKCGPDFIDPGHHALVCGRPSHNIDTWMLPADLNRRIFASACRDADFAVVEGMMGLFDGVSGRGEQGSSAEIAKMLGLPVLLVVDASSSARSVAALVHGFKTFDPELRFAGVVLNRVAGPAHAEMLIEALRGSAPDLWVGWLPHEQDLRLAERYLGLQTAWERSWTRDDLGRMVALLEQHCALDELLTACAITLPEWQERPSLPVKDQPVRIGVPRDRAFCFYYEAGLDELRRQGAEIVEFSPLTEDRLPNNLDALYFGGGYPEFYAEVLSSRKKLFADIAGFAAEGGPIYGECGGLIFLSNELTTQDGRKWPMAGLLPLSIEMTDRLVHFGYAEAEFLEDGLASRGTRVRGHSFHHSKIVRQGEVVAAATVRYTISGQTEAEGFAVGNVFGSYVHVHFAAIPKVVERFVSLAQSYRERGCQLLRH